MNGTRDALRVVVEPEQDATFPAEWGWDEAETAEYMAQVESGEVEVVWLHVQSRCSCCHTWHDTDEAGSYLPALSDVHIKSSDWGISGAIYEDMIPLGPYYPRELVRTGAINGPYTYALPSTASDNYLIQTAADLLEEARSTAQDAAQAI